MTRVERRFRVLQLLARFIWYIGLFTAVIGILVGVIPAIIPSFEVVPSVGGPPSIDTSFNSSNFVRGILVAFASLLGGLQVMAAAELIELYISWESNTRLTKALLDRVLRRK